MSPTPDGVPCRHCGQPIFWDEYSWVHDNGMATCHVTFSGGTEVPGFSGVRITVNPELNAPPKEMQTTAIPVEEDWS